MLELERGGVAGEQDKWDGHDEQRVEEGYAVLEEEVNGGFHVPTKVRIHHGVLAEHTEELVVGCTDSDSANLDRTTAAETRVRPATPIAPRRLPKSDESCAIRIWATTKNRYICVEIDVPPTKNVITRNIDLL